MGALSPGKGFTCVFSNVVQQKGVFSQPLHLCGDDILELQPPAQGIALCILNFNSTISAFVIFIKAIITWMHNIYSSLKHLLLHFPVIKYKTRDAKIYHPDNTSPLHLQLPRGKSSSQQQCLPPLITPHGLGPFPNPSQSAAPRESISLGFHTAAKHGTFVKIISPCSPRAPPSLC